MKPNSEAAIVWLSPDDESTRKLTHLNGIGGPQLSAPWGLVTVSLRNAPASHLRQVHDTPPFEILARFLKTEVTLDRIVFGIGGNAMNRWPRLDVNFHSQEAWFA